MDNHSTERNGTTNGQTDFPKPAFVVVCMTSAVGFVGNVLLIVAHVKDPLKVLKSPSSHFIINIAWLDVLVSGVYFVCFTLLLTSISTDWNWDTSDRSSFLFLFFSLVYAVLFASYLSLAIERFLSVAYPLRHRVQMTTKFCRYWVIGIWLLLGGFRLMDFSLTRMGTLTIIQSHLIYVILLSLLLTLTLSVYIASYISIKRQSMKLRNGTSISEVTIRAAQIRLKNEKTFLVTIAIVCFVLIVTIFPFIISSFVLLLEATNRSEKDKLVPPSYANWVFLLTSLKAAANVFVYLWRLPKYRKTFKKLYQCDC